MKKKTLGRIAVFAFVLCLVSTCLLSGTLAKYTTEATGTGTLTVASFTGITSIATETAEVDYAFNLKDTKVANSNVKDTMIAPGDKGSFNIVLSDSDVAYDYSISIGKLSEDSITFGQFTTNGANIPVKFYSTEALTSPLTAALTGTVVKNDGPKTVTIYWDWKTTNDTTDNVAKDLANKTDNFVVRITATQKIS